MRNAGVPVLYRMEPVGVGGALEAVDVPYSFCSPICRGRFLAGTTEQDLTAGDNTDQLDDGLSCCQCGLLIKCFPFLPLCCSTTIRDYCRRNPDRPFDGEPLECDDCQRGVIYHVATGWRRYWRPCDRCDNPTSFARHDESEPPEGEFCQRCGNWSCPDCVSGFDPAHEGNLCKTCAPKPD